jgi:hypothetical protein
MVRDAGDGYDVRADWTVCGQGQYEQVVHVSYGSGTSSITATMISPPGCSAL